jgi:hypothetical protein
MFDSIVGLTKATATAQGLEPGGRSDGRIRGRRASDLEHDSLNGGDLAPVIIRMDVPPTSSSRPGPCGRNSIEPA